ncbi:MAG: ABC transporter permease [Spirochaetae bacterium HGW-Spirochaetae-9]|nr:MAG: ABC transporter permease [Spirochaetae bacterium HGW-Spirochaetae-9]
MTLAARRSITAYFFLAIPLVFFICVRFGPMLYMMAMSFTNWGLLRKVTKFIGIENYRIVLSDPVFRKALGNTLQYAVFGAPIVIVLSLCVALLLDTIPKGKGLFRLIYVLPYITPVVAVSWVWRWMYQPPPLGVINAILVAVGIPAGDFLNSTTQALPSILGVNVWVEMGYCTTIFLAGLQTIPKELNEAARIDGAKARQVLFQITIPLLAPITFFLVVMEGIQFLRIFTQVYNMSMQAMGGPLDSTKSAALYIYQKAFTNFEMAQAGSASIILFAIIMAVTLIQMKFLDRKVNY